jgi:hypothetical protein
MGKSLSKNDESWNKLFDKYDILNKIENKGFFEIKSEQINEFRESRLMTKFDQKSNLPILFSKNKLSILPVTRGSYVIGKFDTYQKLKYDDKVENINFNFPSNIESLDIKNIYSESSALSCAYVSGIIDDIAGEKTVPTVSGRMSSSSFDYNIRNIISGERFPISVANSQVEIDGGYESENKLILLEAKNFTTDDFLIRQLYYPYRLWNGKIKKDVVPVFMTYSNDVFSFFVYKFTDNREYNSLVLQEQRNYIIGEEPITLDDIFHILNTVKVVPEPAVPFPQADTFERVVDLLGLLTQNDLTKEEITFNYDFAQRQTDYYTNAGIYLGLIDKKVGDKGVTYTINENGKRIMSMKYKRKYTSLIKCILQHEVFNRALRKYFDDLSPIAINDVFDIMKSSYIYHVNKDNTYTRRARSVVKWIEWILDLQD